MKKTMTETAEQIVVRLVILILQGHLTKVEQLTSKARPPPTRWLRASVEVLNLLETRPPRAGPIVTALGCVEDGKTLLKGVAHAGVCQAA